MQNHIKAPFESMNPLMYCNNVQLGGVITWMMTSYQDSEVCEKEK